MKKSARIAEYALAPGAAAGFPAGPALPRLFPVLQRAEILRGPRCPRTPLAGKKGRQRPFLQGPHPGRRRIVHLQKQALHPAHPTHGRRLRPASRLFKLAMENLANYRPRHMQLDVGALHRLCAKCAEEIIASDYQRNPLRPAHPPRACLGRKVKGLKRTRI